MVLLVGDTSGVVTRILGHMILPDLAADRSGSYSMFVKTLIKQLKYHHAMTV